MIAALALAAALSTPPVDCRKPAARIVRHTKRWRAKAESVCREAAPLVLLSKLQRDEPTSPPPTPSPSPPLSAPPSLPSSALATVVEGAFATAAEGVDEPLTFASAGGAYVHTYGLVYLPAIPPIAPVPEPATWLLMVAGVAAFKRFGR